MDSIFHLVNGIAIMGTGMVGGTLNAYFQTRGVTPGLYDPPKGMADVKCLAEAAIIFIAVPTPYYMDGSGFDDSFLRAAIEAIPVPEKVIVIKSTVLPGTTAKLQRLYPQHRFLFSPEFLTEATAYEDTVNPKRQIVGYTEQSKGDAERVLSLLPRAPFEEIVPSTDAEMVKYFCNTFYAMKVAFSNQMFDLCQRMQIDYSTVRTCAIAEPMVGANHTEIYHKDYRGYGGKCLPKDARALIQFAERMGIDLSLLAAAEEYNNLLLRQQGVDIRWQEGSPERIQNDSAPSIPANVDSVAA